MYSTWWVLKIVYGHGITSQTWTSNLSIISGNSLHFYPSNQTSTQGNHYSNLPFLLWILQDFLHLSAYWLACAQIFNSFHLTSMGFGDFWLVWGFFCFFFINQTWEIIAHYLKKHFLHYFYLHSRTPVLCCMITDYILIFVSCLVSVAQNE